MPVIIVLYDILHTAWHISIADYNYNLMVVSLSKNAGLKSLKNIKIPTVNTTSKDSPSLSILHPGTHVLPLMIH